MNQQELALNNPRSSELLIVEDDTTQLKELTCIMEEQGFNSVGCSNVSGAIRQLKKKDFCVALISLNLPEFSEEQFLEKMKPICNRIQIIVYGDLVSLEKVNKEVNQGVFATVEKPISPPDLLGHVHRAFNQELRAYTLKLETELAGRTKDLSKAKEHLDSEIRKRKLQENALKENENQHLSVVNTIVDGVITINNLSIMKSVNPAAVQMFGYNDSKDLIGKNITSLMPEKYRSQHTQSLQRYKPKRDSQIVGACTEIEGLRRDGSTFPIELTVSETQLGNHQIFTGIVRDVSFRKRAEKALQESEQRFSLFMRHLPGCAYMKDKKLRHIFINEAFEKTFNISCNEWLGKTVDDVLPPEIAQPLNENDNRVMSSMNNLKVIETVQQPDGIHKYITCKFPIPQEGKSALLGGVSIDVTESLRTEEMLRKSEERFRQLAENIKEVFWLTDPEKKKMIYISPGYEDIWGRSCDSLYNEPKSFLDAIHPIDRKRVISALKEQEKGKYDEEYKIIRPDGSIRWIHDRAFPIRNNVGKTYRIAGIAEDITDYKKLQDRLTKLVALNKNARTKAQESEKEISKILESITDGFVALDSQWCYRYVNKKAGKLLGRPPKDLLGKNIWQEFPEGIGQPFYHEYHKAMATQKSTSIKEYYLPWKRWFENRIYPTNTVSQFFSRISPNAEK